MFRKWFKVVMISAIVIAGGYKLYQMDLDQYLIGDNTFYLFFILVLFLFIIFGIFRILRY